MRTNAPGLRRTDGRMMTGLAVDCVMPTNLRRGRKTMGRVHHARSGRVSGSARSNTDAALAAPAPARTSSARCQARPHLIDDPLAELPKGGVRNRPRHLVG